MVLLLALAIAICSANNIDSVQVFENPRRQHPQNKLWYAVDACVGLGTGCGEAAALAFCEENGFTNTTASDGRDKVAQPRPDCATTLTAKNEICTPVNSGDCGCFRFIVCAKPNNN